MSLTNKVAVIIGATGQLGPTVAKMFVQAGAKVALVSSQSEHLDTLRRELNLRESYAMYRLAETMDEAEMTALADAVRIKFGRADILVHLVGSFRGGMLSETPPETWDYLFQRNVFSAVNAIRAFLPCSLKTNGGVSSPPPRA